MKPIIIGIAGASASGKSLLANTICDELQAELGKDMVAIIPQDNYYKDRSDLDFCDRESINYDHPNAFDNDLLIAQVDKLKANQAVELPQYDFTIHNRSDRLVKLAPKKVIILEGILLLNDAQIRERLDMMVYMDAPLDICMIRRLKRDIEERGRTFDSVIDQYMNTVRPMFLQFIEPSKQYADLVIPRGGKNRIAIDALKAQIKQLIHNA